MSKVPFALHRKSNKYVDVHEVPRGKDCNCICPSCQTQLAARQGDTNTWHFAHLTQGTSDQTSNDCEFSFYVSVVQMAKQLFSEQSKVELSLPEYIYTMSEPHPINGRLQVKNVLVTHASTVQLSDITIECSLTEHPADVLGHVGQIPIIVGLHHKEKPFRADPDLLGKAKAGILRIDLTNTWKVFFGNETKSYDSFKQRLASYLFSSDEHKEWLYHPREEKRLQQARDEVFATPSNANQVSTNSKSAEGKGDFIDRALAGFQLERKRRR